MKKQNIVVIVIAAAAIIAGAAFYFVPGLNPSDSGTGSNSGNAPDGSGAAGQKVSYGVISGTARAASGATPKFESVTVILSDSKTDAQKYKTNLSADGSYKFTVNPGEYKMSIFQGGSSPQLPRIMYVGAGETFSLNFSVK
ncbi:MAG: carboxypeptidase regulatory-like domain-containing protein [Candidatus Liptonbacteria bacterium]|nr:carboxypeptidase regulatory-like domain-containing protein [Candidatus Liptonbacteria bacterium]